MHTQLARLRRLALFGLVGLTNTALIYVLYVALIYLGMGYNWAVVVDYAVGMLLGYLLQRKSTFRDRQPSPGAFAKYALTNVLAFGIDLGLLNLLVTVAQWHPAAARVVSIGIMAAVSFALQMLWVFRPARGSAADLATQASILVDAPHYINGIKATQVNDTK